MAPLGVPPPDPLFHHEPLQVAHAMAYFVEEGKKQYQPVRAIRPSGGSSMKAVEGYKKEVPNDGGEKVEYIIASLSREKIFHVIMDVLCEFPEDATVDISLGTSHASPGKGTKWVYRDEMDRVVLQSMLQEFEPLVVDDGATDLIIKETKNDRFLEIMLDEHKQLSVMDRTLGWLERILTEEYGVPRRQKMHFASEGDHEHVTNGEFEQQWRLLAIQLGAYCDFEALFE